MQRLNPYFPLFAMIACAPACLFPAAQADIKVLIIPLLMLIMSGPGMTLTPGDFSRVFARPGVILAGLTLQFATMPLATYRSGRSETS